MPFPRLLCLLIHDEPPEPIDLAMVDIEKSSCNDPVECHSQFLVDNPMSEQDISVPTKQVELLQNLIPHPIVHFCAGGSKGKQAPFLAMCVRWLPKLPNPSKPILERRAQGKVPWKIATVIRSSSKFPSDRISRPIIFPSLSFSMFLG